MSSPGSSRKNLIRSGSAGRETETNNAQRVQFVEKIFEEKEEKKGSNLGDRERSKSPSKREKLFLRTSSKERERDNKTV